MKSIVLLLVMSSVAMGQLSTDEAQARLKARQAAATSQPSAEVLTEYKQIIADLRAENQKLKAQVAQLQAELKSRPPKSETSAEGAMDVNEWKSHLVGMTLDEAHKSAEGIAAREKEPTTIGKPAMVSAVGDLQTWRMGWATMHGTAYYLFTVRGGKIASFMIE